MTSPARERLLQAAHTLLSTRGLHHVSVDDIVREGGSTKATLYKYYRGKDDLILAVLRLEAQDFLQWLQDTVAHLEPRPERQLLVVFDALTGWFARPTFRGCLLTRLVIELADPHHPAVQVLQDHRRRVREYLTVLARQAGQPDPDRLAAELHLVLEGATLLAGVGQDRDALRRAKLITGQLLVPHPRSESTEGGT
ncbi:hypothetical protein DEIPH_ctg139orf0080 [Deinococcus phoenicis]|uniref:HTH tetR-type domain-containing protein n=1 Tax=Deinococcus phoenicis TaxID=1476583 RepID=A0A016QKD9_9DEIO|nr:TetR/AcrR family transcriptional regulator [Deinococcus phoenicis]EYB66357.1 hypothetical protein DEIPH_ctg139orf0080 [Deinococcus phoenicis]